MSDAWKSQAMCQGADPILFFGPRHFEPKWERILRIDSTIKGYCNQCPVVRECGEYADEVREYGIWGGTYRESGNTRMNRLRGRIRRKEAREVQVEDTPIPPPSRSSEVPPKHEEGRGPAYGTQDWEDQDDY